MNIFSDDHPIMNTKAHRASHSSSDTQSLTSTAIGSGSPTGSPNPSNNTSGEQDPSKDVNKQVPGWPELAKLIAENPDLEAFPAFTDLQIKSLLYYQAELIYLRKELHAAEWNDHRNGNSSDGSSEFATDLELLYLVASAARDDENVTTPKQWELMVQIREVLEKYSK
jgi:Family of unknown function (DUF6594)